MVVKPDVPMELGNGPMTFVVGSDAPSMTADPSAVR